MAERELTGLPQNDRHGHGDKHEHAGLIHDAHPVLAPRDERPSKKNHHDHRFGDGRLTGESGAKTIKGTKQNAACLHLGHQTSPSVIVVPSNPCGRK